MYSGLLKLVSSTNRSIDICCWLPCCLVSKGCQIFHWRNFWTFWHSVILSGCFTLAFVELFNFYLLVFASSNNCKVIDIDFDKRDFKHKIVNIVTKLERQSPKLCFKHGKLITLIYMSDDGYGKHFGDYHVTIYMYILNIYVYMYIYMHIYIYIDR